jgi:serine acetyltransferase
MSPPIDTAAQRRPVPLLHGLAGDLHAHLPAPAVEAHALRLVGWYVRLLLSTPSLRAGLLYRLSHWFAFRFGMLGGACSAMIHWLSRRLYCCSISPAAFIQGGLILPHPQNIVIGGEVAIGARAFIFHNVTIGGAPGKTGAPVIGSHCTVYTGAVVAGPIQIGDNVQIAANVVVTTSIPGNARVHAQPSTWTQQPV